MLKEFLPLVTGAVLIAVAKKITKKTVKIIMIAAILAFVAAYYFKLPLYGFFTDILMHG